MLKRIALLTRKPGMTKQQFFDHWNNVHGPLIAEHPNVLRYVQNNVVKKERFVDRNPDPDNPLPAGYDGPEVDGVVELWFESREKMDELFASPHAKKMQADGLLHLGTITTFVVDERPVVDRSPANQSAGLAINLKGQRVLITGAAGGIGRALVRGLAAAGASIVAADFNPGTLTALKDELAGQRIDIETHVLDVSDRAACVALAGTLADAPITALVNNAGITAPYALNDDDAYANWDKIWSVNAAGVFNVTKAFLEQIKAARGSILNMSSVAARAARGRNTAYQSSKAAVTQMTRGWAVELAPFHVRVNALAPGMIETPFMGPDAHDEARIGQMLSRVPMGRRAKPDELVGAAAFLLSPLASYVTGTVMGIDGGFDAT
ncbi:MAG: SDR family oxidoreductase [Proteobacteria bacterium]|nr:SDR family oxidoreductase [Pseudomonadota bacterium]